MKKYLLDTSLVAGFLLAREKAIALVSPLIEREKAATSIDAIAKVVEREETCSTLVDICDACFLDETLA